MYFYFDYIFYINIFFHSSNKSSLTFHKSKGNHGCCGKRSRQVVAVIDLTFAGVVNVSMVTASSIIKDVVVIFRIVGSAVFFN